MVHFTCLFHLIFKIISEYELNYYLCTRNGFYAVPKKWSQQRN